VVVVSRRARAFDEEASEQLRIPGREGAVARLLALDAKGE
jgi:hypothetical protein